MPKLDVGRLEDLGFFRHVRPADLPRVRAEVETSNFPFSSSAEDHRFYHADAECLAEGGVRDFLGEVAPFLRREGVSIDVTYRKVKVPRTQDRPAGWGVATLNAEGWFDDDEHGPYPRVESMRIREAPGSAACEVTQDDFQESEIYLLFFGDREYVIYDFEPGEVWEGWRRATVATIALLNRLLSAHGSAERAYAFQGDNQLYVAFATPEMAAVVNAAAAPREHLHDGTDAW